MKEINLGELMKLYRKTTQGEWKQLVALEEPDSDFCCQVHNSFPAIVERLRVAEKKNEIFLKWLNDDNCPFKAIEGKDLCDGSCPGCVTANIDSLAIEELKKEGTDCGK